MKLATHRIRRRILAGFTLIELLVVIIILAALAALIVPNIGMYGRSTDMAVSAKSQADIANQVQLFFVTQKRYPQGLDSLLTSGGTVYVATTTAPAPATINADNQTGGLPFAGADGTRLQSQLSVGTLTPANGAAPISIDTNPDYLRSLTRGGLD
ncbi:MAG: prepilin-type N-terminal cleavage/methylation domain-containing protein, partial [Verrucomicrobium sp.]